MFHPPHPDTSRQAEPLSETQLLTTLHRLGDGVLFLDSTWRVRYANLAAERLALAPDAAGYGSTFRSRYPDFDHDVLDEALLRPGRFDRHITIDRPAREGREAILKVHCRRVPLSDDVDLGVVAGVTIGMSGAALKNLVNEAALSAARAEQTRVTQADFEYAHDRVLMGPKREEVLSEGERRKTAYHEAGHALLAWLMPEVDAVHKVTVIPRGPALGVTQLLPEEELYHLGESRLHAQLVSYRNQ